MATMTISLPDPMKDWIEAKVAKGGYASTSDDVRDLVRRDRGSSRTRYPDNMTIEDLRLVLEESRASGVSTKTMKDIITEGDRIAKERGFFRDEASDDRAC